MRSKSDANTGSEQNCVLLPITSCAKAVGIEDCAYDAAGEDLCAGAKEHSYLQKPGRGIPSPSLPPYSSPVLEATSNDQCHVENPGPGRVPVLCLQRSVRSVSQPLLRLEQCGCTV